MRIYPPFLPCLRYAIKTFGLIYIFLFALALIANAIKHQPFLATFRGDLSVLLIAIIAIPAGLASVVYLGARAWAWSIDQYGLKGRSYWGRRVTIKWSDVVSVKNTSVEGVPALLIGSSTGKAELFAYTLGVNIPDIYTHLYRYAGPDHMLTQSFTPSAA